MTDDSGCRYRRPEPECGLWVCRGPTDTTQEKERDSDTLTHNRSQSRGLGAVAESELTPAERDCEPERRL